VHRDAVDAFVAAVDRGRYRCLIDSRVVTAMKARELGPGSIVVGDQVSLAGDVTGAPGSLARIVRVAQRRSVLRRSADDTDPVERVVVANATQLVIVSALAEPPPQPRLIDRFLVAAFDAGLSPLLCLTKADLAAPDELAALYEPLQLRWLAVGRPYPPGALAELRQSLAGQLSVLVGSSGVGKSTLVNALIPDAERVTGEVNPVTGRGRHTSSSVVALPLPPPGGWIVDTPGLRSFGLGHMSADRVISAFGDLAAGTAGCRPGCGHLAGADCALDAWVASQPASARAPLAARLESLRRLLASREGADSDFR
jgi:ribosome biogenesis GTPase